MGDAQAEIGGFRLSFIRNPQTIVDSRKKFLVF